MEYGIKMSHSFYHPKVFVITSTCLAKKLSELIQYDLVTRNYFMSMFLMSDFVTQYKINDEYECVCWMIVYYAKDTHEFSIKY